VHVGLIGGIGPAATDYYYRRLINACPDRLDLTIAHADAATLLGNLAAGRAVDQADIFATLSRRLAAAGAAAVAVTSIAGHFCADEFAQRSPLPVIDLLETVADAVLSAGHQRVGVLGTEPVMRSGLFGRLSGVEVLAPGGRDLTSVHESYVATATRGTVSDAERETFFRAGAALHDRGAAVILLGGTDLCLAFDGPTPGFPVLDCALLHVERIAAEARRPER
jgi:aspartate racemase